MKHRTAATRPVKVPKPRRSRLAVRGIHGHVEVTATHLVAWYLLDPSPWSFTAGQRRMNLIHDAAQTYAALVGRDITIRVTSAPYPAARWARRLDEATVAPIGGRALGGVWDHALAAGQDAIRKSTLAEKRVYMGVHLPRRRTVTGAVASLRDGGRGEVEGRAEELRGIARAVGAADGDTGGVCVPASTADVEWLIHRSIRLGLPAVEGVTPADEDTFTDDTAIFTDNVDQYPPHRFAPTTVVTDGTRTAHVAVLAVGHMRPMTLPPAPHADPWMSASDRMRFPVEWVAHFQIMSGAKVARTAQSKILGVRDMERQYRMHGLDEPLDLADKVEHAKRIEHDATHGSPVEQTSVRGFWRCAVSGADEADAVANAQTLINHYQRRLGITLHHPRGIHGGGAQVDLLREFVPGERVQVNAFRRFMPALMAAAALPQVASTIGDGRGPLMGHTTGSSRRAFTIDPHFPNEVLQRSNAIVTFGGLGSGKSGSVVAPHAYWETLRGVTSTVMDPSGSLAALCDIPALAGHARHLDLVEGEPGLLSPYRVIHEPNRADHDTDADYIEARAEAEHARRALASDVIRGLVPARMRERSSFDPVLSQALLTVGGSPDASLYDVIDALQRSTRDAVMGGDIAVALQEVAEHRQARLFFNSGADVPAITETLLVLTMSGIRLPDLTTDPTTWELSERIGLPVLNLAAHMVVARSYGLGRGPRKFVALDEVGLLSTWSSGRAMLARLFRDNRKWNLVPLLASQDAADILGLGVENWVSTVYAGRTEGSDAARDALRVLTGADAQSEMVRDPGYRSILSRLSASVTTRSGATAPGPREFLVRDPQGNIDTVRVNLGHAPDLLRAIVTEVDPHGGRNPSTGTDNDDDTYTPADGTGEEAA